MKFFDFGAIINIQIVFCGLGWEDGDMYQSGDYVIYGIHGACRVLGREKQLVNKKRTEFLVLEPLMQSGSKYYVPAENPTAMAKLQAVLSQDELVQLLESDAVREDCWISDEGRRKQTYRELITSADRLRLMQMVASLYRYRGGTGSRRSKIPSV